MKHSISIQAHTRVETHEVEVRSITNQRALRAGGLGPHAARYYGAACVTGRAPVLTGHGGEQESERASESQREMHADAADGYGLHTHATVARLASRRQVPVIIGTRLHTGCTNIAVRNSRSHTR